MIQHKVITDDAIDIGRCKRRRVRVLVPAGARIDARETRDIAMAVRDAVWKRHGAQAALKVLFYTDIFTPVDVLGAWDYCPGGVWANAFDRPDDPMTWVLKRYSQGSLQNIQKLSAGVGTDQP